MGSLKIALLLTVVVCVASCESNISISKKGSAGLGDNLSNVSSLESAVQTADESCTTAGASSETIGTVNETVSTSSETVSTSSETVSTNSETETVNANTRVASTASSETMARESQFSADITFINFQEAQKEKVKKAIAVIKKVIRTQEFKDMVLSYKFYDDSGLTNQQIYQSLLDGSEEQTPGIDRQMNVELALYYTPKNTVGYTNTGDSIIHMNTRFFNTYTPISVAAHIFHEWTHKLGFGHDKYWSVARDSSVPYALGTMMEKLGKKYE